MAGEYMKTGGHATMVCMPWVRTVHTQALTIQACRKGTAVMATKKRTTTSILVQENMLLSVPESTKPQKPSNVISIRKPLFRLIQQQFFGETVETINGRELHRFLGVKTSYNHWINRALDSAQMVENTNYIVLVKFDQNPKGGRPKKEYYLTEHCCEHLGMMADEVKGKQIRDYFIEARDALVNHLRRRPERPAPSPEKMSFIQRYLLDEPQEFEPQYKGLFAAVYNALNEKTRQGIPKLPTDLGSERVAGIVPKRIQEGYKLSFGDDVYEELKSRFSEGTAQAMHQLIQSKPFYEARAMLIAFALAATSEQHYCDLINAVSKTPQLSMPWRWPVRTSDDDDKPVETA